MKRLFVVEQTFAIAGRGTILAPHVLLGERGTYEIVVELRRPDGTHERCAATAHVPMTNPMSEQPAHAVIVPLGVAVSVGTEVYLVDVLP